MEISAIEGVIACSINAIMLLRSSWAQVVFLHTVLDAIALQLRD